MKEDIQKSVTEMIDKSGVEIDADERQKIVGEAIDAALEHIAQVLKTVSLAEGSSYMRVWVRFGESPELSTCILSTSSIAMKTSSNAL